MVIERKLFGFQWRGSSGNRFNGNGLIKRGMKVRVGRVVRFMRARNDFGRWSLVGVDHSLGGGDFRNCHSSLDTWYL